MTKSIADLQAGRRATRDWKRAVAIIIAAAALGFLAAAVFAQTAHAQVQTARVTTKDSVRITVVSTKKVDTVIKTVVIHDTVYVVKPPVTPPSDTIVTPPIVSDTTRPPTTGSPAPQPGDVILYQQSTLSGLAKRGDVTQVGTAFRFTYSPGSSDNLVEPTWSTPATDLYVRYRYRITAGALPYSGRTGSGMKHIMFWRSTAPRYTCGVGMLTTPNWLFTCHDNGSTRMPNPTPQSLSLTPNFATINDGNYHDLVYHIVTGNSGFEEIWCDGRQVYSTRGRGYDHDAGGITLLQYPGVVVDGIPDAAHGFVIDIDGLVAWHK